MRLGILASGSSGNATVVEHNGRSVLIDCGLSYRQLVERMRLLGLSPNHIAAVFLTHEHTDHVRGLEVFLKRHSVPVLATAGTGTAIAITLDDVLVSGKEIAINGLNVLPVATSHDANEPVGFVIAGDGLRIGLVTDCGVITELIQERLAGCSHVLLECNHDVDMLRIGPYPWPLKQRILSRRGHLSNLQARDALERLLHGELKAVVAMHVSQENNTSTLVRREINHVLAGSQVSFSVADQFRPLLIDTDTGSRSEIHTTITPPAF